MKRFIYGIIIAAVLVTTSGFISCDNSYTPGVSGQLDVLFSFSGSVTPVTSPFTYFDAGEGGPWTGFLFIVRTDQSAWQAVSSQSWCDLEEYFDVNGEDGFYISFEPNPTDLLRTVTITVTADNAAPVSFSIEQKGGINGKGLYLGTWRSNVVDGFWEQFIVSESQIVCMNSNGSNYTLTDLTWTETVNQGVGSGFTSYFSDGYKITGKLAATNGYNIVPKETGTGKAAVGDMALVTLYIGDNKNYLGLGNYDTAEQEAYYGSYNWKSNVEYWQVTWNLNGGSWQSNPNQAAQVAKDGKLAVPKNPTKSGVYFIGWYKEAALTNQVSFPYDVSSVKGNFTLYAKWGGPATLRVTIMAGPGFYASISAMPVSGGAVQTSIPTSIGTHTVNVPPGTYNIYTSYWASSYVGDWRAGYSSNFTVSSGQTKNISIVNGSVGFP